MEGIFASANLGELFGLFGVTFTYFLQTIEYWLPIVLLIIFIITWKNYVRAHYRVNLETSLIEIRLPREIRKSPQAMEVVYAFMHNTADGSWINKYWDGQVRVNYVLEIASIEGSIHFFARAQKVHMQALKARIYSQYPEVEIIDPAEDYTLNVDYGEEGSEWDLFGTEIKLTEPDPYPIKTYVDYELDKISKEEEKVDPMTPIIEYMGSIGKDEQVWFQLHIRAAEDRFRDGLFKKRSWKKEGEALVEKLRKKQPKPGEIVLYDTKLLSPGEEQVVKRIERSLDKLGYDIGIRFMYLAKKHTYSKSNIPGILGAWKQFNSMNCNGFKHMNPTVFDYPWQDFKGIRMSYRKRRMFNGYKMRSYFYPPYESKSFVLSSEELATIFHFPGQVVQTPTMFRTPSRTSEPPRDLPSVDPEPPANLPQ